MSGIEPVTVAIVVAALNLAFSMLGGGIFVGRVMSRLDAHDADTKRIETGLNEMKTLLISSAVEANNLRRAEADIENIENDLRNLRRGVGWIKDDGARAVDREY